jgi:hypothetical protein
MYSEVVSDHFYRHKVSQKFRFGPLLSDRRIIGQKWSKSDFFLTPYDGKNGRKGLQHTFLHQPNIFCVMNFAVKLSAELRSVPVF